MTIEEIIVNPWFLFLVSAGVPSLLIARISHKMDLREKENQLKEERREKLILLTIKATNAAIALGEATAKAVQRIPDAHCNGDMHEALQYAEDIKREQKDYLAELGVKSLVS